MLELWRERAPKEQMQDAQGPRWTGWTCSRGEASGRKCGYLVYGSLAAVVNGHSNVKDGYYKEGQLDSGAAEHVIPDGAGMAE